MQGKLHVLRSALEELAAAEAPAGRGPPPGAERPPATAAARNLARVGLRWGLRGWLPLHDLRLIRGVLKHGLGRCGLEGFL
jgi:hypothetical protein